MQGDRQRELGPMQIAWFDMAAALAEPELAFRFEKYGEVLHCLNEQQLESWVVSGKVDVVCLNFDYPNRKNLRFVQEFKSAYPSVPMVFLTLQHSESLAVWSFRNRMWDFMVKPLSRDEIERCFTGLEEVRSLRPKQPARGLRKLQEQIPEEAAAPVPVREEQALLPAVNFIDKYFRSKIMIEEVAQVCGMSPFRFSREFKQVYGRSFNQYLTCYRLQVACRMLQNPTAVVGDVGYTVGFNDASYFTRQFRKFYGLAPSDALGHTPDDLKSIDLRSLSSL